MDEMNFEKFNADLEKRQEAAQQKRKAQAEAEKEWPARKMAEKYRENPGNRITWGKK